MNMLRMGTRGSPLALAQSGMVAAQVRARTGVDVQLVVIRTRGDDVVDRPLAAVGGKGLFTKEIELALLAGEVDFAVHSLKDLPTIQPEGLTLAATPPREDPRDVLIGGRLAELKLGAVVGTGSQRRQAQLLAARPDLVVRDIRGNVDTRIRKLQAGEFDAIVLAAAGVIRLGRAAEITERLSVDAMVPAPGQGALALQCRVGDAAAAGALLALHDADAALEVEAERAWLDAAGGGCTVPTACYVQVDSAGATLRGFHLRPDGVRRRVEERVARADVVARARALGAEAAG